MMENSKKTLLTMIVLAVLACGAAVLLIKMQVHPPGTHKSKPLTGVELFVQICGAQGQRDVRCTSMVAIRKAFGFDLMAEINDRYKKMKKTAADIAAGGLSDDAYKVCLKAKTCAEVPMLDDENPVNTPKAKAVSRAFWDLADGKSLTLSICKFMPLCSTALVNDVVTVRKNKIIPTKAKKS